MPPSDPRDGGPGRGHYPYQTAIDAYGGGGFRFADMSHRGSLICVPSGMHAWGATSPDEIDLASLERVMAQAAEIEVLLIGMGEGSADLPPGIREALRVERIMVEAVSTGSAVRTYNVLLAEDRPVAAALIAVEGPR